MTKTFPNTGSNFSGLHAAKRWLRNRGYAVGLMDGDDPVAVRYVSEGETWAYSPAWSELNGSDRARLDGRLESADYKSGAVVLTLTGGPLGMKIQQATPPAPEARSLQPEAPPDTHGEEGKPGGSPQPATIANGRPAGPSGPAGSRLPEEGPKPWQDLSVEERAEVRKRIRRDRIGGLDQ